MKPVLSPLFLAFVLCFLHSEAPRSEDTLIGSEITVKTVEIKGQVWPEVHVLALIKAPPLSSAAIFAAYDYQKNYIPKLLKSEVTSETVTESSNFTEVSYALDMPWPLKDSHYVHAHVLEKVDKGLKVSWYKIKSDVTEAVKGHAIFAPHPQNPSFTLMTYVNLVTPKSFFAGIFKKLMIGDVLKSVQAIRQKTEELLVKNPQLVRDYEDKIKLVLKGKQAYLNK